MPRILHPCVLEVMATFLLHQEKTLRVPRILDHFSLMQVTRTIFMLKLYRLGLEKPAVSPGSVVSVHLRVSMIPGQKYRHVHRNFVRAIATGVWKAKTVEWATF